MKKIQSIFCFSIIAAAISTTGCSKPGINEQGLTEDNLDASFTITPVSANRFVVTANDSSYILSKWDVGDGGGAQIGRHKREIFLPDAGTYTITHYAVGKGGATFTESETINVATSDPVAGNLVVGGKFEEAADDAQWTRHVIGAPAIQWTMANGKMTATGGNWGHSAIYQAVTVEADKDYRFSMLVSGSGATETWFEVYFGSTAPVANSDYSDGGIQIALNTWAGCGNTAFNGNINAIGCDGALKGKDGVVRFATGGTKYIFIKTGGNNLGTSGISIDNVELRGM